MPRKINLATTKPATVKPVAPAPVPAPVNVKPATAPDAAKLAAKQAVSNERADSRAAAKRAVAEFYAGTSLPFKAAADLPYKADLNPALQRAPTERTAALIAAIISYCDVARDGSFKRGSGRVPGKLLGRTGADGERLFSAGPESGCTSNMLGAQIVHVSGALGGKQAAETVLRLTDKAIANLLAFNVAGAGGKRRFADVLKHARETLDAAKFPSLATGA